MRVRFSLALVACLAATLPAAELSVPITFKAMCDASAASSLSSNLFVVANDEDNVLRVYQRDQGGLPKAEFDLNAFLHLKPKHDEADLEGCAKLDGQVYWISSHGANAKGEPSPGRHQFFATRFAVNDTQITMERVGAPYKTLVRDLARDSRYAPFHLLEAAQRAPKTNDALNIEGLTTTPEGHLLIAFRNPIPGGRALLTPLLNAAEIVAGQPPKFGDPILLDLGGYGVRSIGWSKDRYLIIAGSHNSEGESRLYEWRPAEARPVLVPGVRFPGSNPEGLSFDDGDGRSEYFIVSDDGTNKVGGEDCKRVKDPALRYFRGYFLRF